MYRLTRKEGCRVGRNQPSVSERVSQRVTKRVAQRRQRDGGKVVLGNVVYLGQLGMCRVWVVCMCWVDAHGCSSGSVVLQNGVLHCGDGRAGGYRHSGLLNVDLLQCWRRWSWGQVGSCCSGGCCCSSRGKCLHLFGQKLLLDVLLGSLLQFAVFLHLLWCERDGLTLQRSQSVLLRLHALFLQGGWWVSRVGMHLRLLLLHFWHEGLHHGVL